MRMFDKDRLIKGIEECNLNGGLLGNCPYKDILILLKHREQEIENLKEIIINADRTLESVKEKLNELLYEDFRRGIE